MDPWNPALSSAGLFFLTFLSEDTATIAGAWLAATQRLAWENAFLACFLGIWLGDLGLYALARICGRPLVDRLWIRRAATASRLERSEAWFATHGWFALVICRLVPGTRLPTFLAAGFLRMPAMRFALVTGTLALLWVAALFALIHKFGTAHWLGPNESWGLAAAALLAFTIVAGRPLWLPRARRWMQGPSIQRWLQWEFWPAWLFYLPVAINYARLAIKYGGFTVPSAANPGMHTGGLIGESKHETLAQLETTSPEFTARSFLLAPGDAQMRTRLFEERLVAHEFDYPVVLKPDVAQRGSGFRVARNPAEAAAYIGRVEVPVVVQEYVSGPHEAGVFYYRHPGEPHGRILAITEKIFPVIFGDGERTVEQLIAGDARAAIMAPVYLRRFAGMRDVVLPFGKPLRLVEAGNHAQGCIFRDGMHLWTEQLEARIDDISRRLPGFFIGRYDVRYAAADDLKNGREFLILELNGAASEATSAYDVGKSLADAYRLLFRQWELVFSIGAANRRAGHSANSLMTLWTEARRYRRTSVCHPTAD